MAKVLSQLLFAREQCRAALLIATIAVLVTAGAGIVLSPGFGVGGIAFSAALGFVTYAAGLGLFLNKAGWWGPDRRLLDRVLRTFAATGIMSAALFVTQRPLPASEASVPGLAALCLAGLVLYTGAALALRVVTPSELRRLWRAPGVRLP